LGEQTAKVAALGPAMDSAHQIKHLRRQLKAQDQKQEERINQLKTLLLDVLKDQIVEQLREELTNNVKDQIAQQVKEQVNAQLTDQITLALKVQAREHRKQIGEVRRSLTNSEARRANTLLRSNNLSDSIHPLLRPNGEVSPIFPKNLAATFAMDGGNARELCHEYGLPESESREANINKFMHHIGVAFQLIASPTSPEKPWITGV